jgi:geranylgeranyl pyrophosphate synthase
MADVQLGLATAPVLLALEHAPEVRAKILQTSITQDYLSRLLPARKPYATHQSSDCDGVFPLNFRFQLTALVERRCREPGDLEQAMAWVDQAGGVQRTEQLAATYAPCSIWQHG